MNLRIDCATVRQYGSVRQCERQCVAVPTVVCAQCAQQCAAVRLEVYGSARGCVRLSGSAAVCGCVQQWARQCAGVQQCAAVCGSVWE
jgi:hypothetical protein